MLASHQEIFVIDYQDTYSCLRNTAARRSSGLNVDIVCVGGLSANIKTTMKMNNMRGSFICGLVGILVGIFDEDFFFKKW